jgi:hypothetical protein
MIAADEAVAGLRGLDHVLIGVRDLEAARHDWQLLGFTACPRGRHIGWGTANYCLMLEHDYIELIGIVDPSQFTNNLDIFLESREGLLGLAYASDHMEATAAALGELGIAADGPRDLKRILELPEGEVRPAFELLFPDPETLPAVRAFICRHLTPEMVWRPQWTRHANTAKAILEIVGVAEDPPAHAVAYRRIFGAGSVVAERGRLEVAVGGPTRLLLVRPDNLRDVMPQAADGRAYAAPWLAGLGISVGNIDAAKGVLQSNGIAFHDAGTSLCLLPDAANGVALELRQA